MRLTRKRVPGLVLRLGLLALLWYFFTANDDGAAFILVLGVLAWQIIDLAAYAWRRAQNGTTSRS